MGAADLMGGPAGHRRERARGVLVVVAIVLLASGVSRIPIPQAFAHQDKLHHLAGFFLFAWALRGAFPRLGTGAVLAAGAGVAVALEAMQLLLPLRTSSLADVLASTTGVALACALQAWRRGAGATAVGGADR